MPVELVDKLELELVVAFDSVVGIVELVVVLELGDNLVVLKLVDMAFQVVEFDWGAVVVGVVVGIVVVEDNHMVVVLANKDMDTDIVQMDIEEMDKDMASVAAQVE